MGLVTIRYIVFIIVNYYIYLDIIDGACYYKTHGVCYCQLLYLLRHNRWDMLLLNTWGL